MVVVLLFAVLAQVVAGLFSADTDMGTVNGPLANLIADKWVDRVTHFHEFLGERAPEPGRLCMCWPPSSTSSGSGRT